MTVRALRTDTVDGYMSAIKVYLEIEGNAPLTTLEWTNAVSAGAAKRMRQRTGISLTARKACFGIGGHDMNIIRPALGTRLRDLAGIAVGSLSYEVGLRGGACLVRGE